MTTIGIQNPNPYRDPGPWGVVEIDGGALPGIVLTVDGADKPEEWNIQKPSDKSGASSVWKGTKTAEGIKIVVSLTTELQVDLYYALRDKLRPPGQKPPTFVIANPSINFARIDQVACQNMGAPKWVKTEAYWTGEITLVEVTPEKKANTGTAGGAGQGTKDIQKDGPDPNAGLNARIEKLVAEINAIDAEEEAA